jgi:hypothetical protein
MLLLAGMLIPGCHRKKDPEEQRLLWSTEAPLSIPYHTRLQRLEKKNLIRNHSFEEGRTFKLESAKTSFVIDGWQQIGQHVEWVDTRLDSLFSPDEALSGYRAVKITRRHANETDEQGEGILSDFIKVIPGNYSLSFYTRLKNIRTVKGRLGIKMYDAVDVRLLFFDKSKIAMRPDQEFPHLDQNIDNSFKSLSLANFDSISVFGWGKIIGKSAAFPFFDGDIPTNAHYVKIFIGLKGTGTMWIDSVDYSYTRRNFSVEERMLGYADTSLRFQPFVIPTPRKMQRMESVIFYDPQGVHHLPVVTVPANADPHIRYAADMLQNALSERTITAGGGPVPQVMQIRESDNEILPNNGGLTFFLGCNGLFEKYREFSPLEEIRGHPQGYIIYSPADRPHDVFLEGNSAVGVYYAVLTAIQLIDSRQPVYHNAKVVDYPDFEKRFYTLGRIRDDSDASRNVIFAKELESFKLNGIVYKPDDSTDHGVDAPMKIFRQLTDGSGDFYLTGVFPRNPGSGQLFSGIIYAPEMKMPDASSLCYPCPVDLKISEDMAGICRSTGNFRNNPVQSIYVVQPAFNNQLLDYSLNRVILPGTEMQAYAPVYSGSSFFSLNTDDADFKRYIDYAKRKPVFMDNSMLISSPRGHYNGAFPYLSGKIRLYNLFEPFINTGIRDHLNQLDSTLLWMNNPAASEIDVIRLSTAADFMWNARDYDPDYSLWKVLCSRYGAEAARALIHYADQYSLLLEIELKLMRNEPIPRNLKNLQTDLLGLDSVIRDLKRILKNSDPLLRDILSLNEILEKRIERFIPAGKP